MDNETDSNILGFDSTSHVEMQDGVEKIEACDELEFQEVDIEGNSIFDSNEIIRHVDHDGLSNNYEGLDGAKKNYDNDDKLCKTMDRNNENVNVDNKHMLTGLRISNSDSQEIHRGDNNIQLGSETFQIVPDIFSLLRLPLAKENYSECEKKGVPEKSEELHPNSNSLSDLEKTLIPKSTSANFKISQESPECSAFVTDIQDYEVPISKRSGEQEFLTDSNVLINADKILLEFDSRTDALEVTQTDPPVSPGALAAFDIDTVETLRKPDSLSNCMSVMSLSLLGRSESAFSLSEDEISEDEVLLSPKKRNHEKSNDRYENIHVQAEVEDYDRSSENNASPPRKRLRRNNDKDENKKTPIKLQQTNSDESFSESIDESEYNANNSDSSSSDSCDESASDDSLVVEAQVKQNLQQKKCQDVSYLSADKSQGEALSLPTEETQYERKVTQADKSQDEDLSSLPEETQHERNVTETDKSIVEKRILTCDNKMRNIPLHQKVASSSEGSKWYDDKKNFCKYCLTKVLRIDRHLISQHINEKDVLQASLEPPRSKARRQMLGRIRMEGNDMFNSNRTINPEGEIICARRLRVKKPATIDSNEDNQLNGEEGKKVYSKINLMSKVRETVQNPENKENAENEAPSVTKSKQMLPLKVICPHCPGYYSANTLRNHIKLMHDTNTGSRNQLTMSKGAMGLCHERASVQVRKYILPPLKIDMIGRAARFDLLIILYANKYAVRYSSPDQQGYVRGHMRLLAKLLIAVKQINSKISDLATVFRPLYWNIVNQAINVVCELDQEKNRFAVIYNAETLPIIIRKCIKILKFEYTIQENKEKLDHVEAFEKVFDNEAEISISYIAFISRKEANRHKNAPTLPDSKEVYCFETYLILKRSVSLKHFEEGGRNYEHYLNITQTTAVLILLYNRRRVGEISKTLLKDFLCAKRVDPHSEFFQMLSDEEQKQRSKYIRIDIHGKKREGKGSLYICTNNEESLNLLVKYRSLFIPQSNEYLFALPDGHDGQSRHIKISELMSKLSKECTKEYKEIEDKTMRGTLLRQQLATMNGALEDEGASSEIITNHMGHSKQVHKVHYKQRIDGEDVAITKLLDRVRTGTIKKSKEVKDTISKPVSQCNNLDASTSSSDCEVANNLHKKKNKTEKAHRLPTSLKIGKAKVSRKSWTSDEIYAFQSGFKSRIQAKTYPSASEIRAVQEKYPALKNRSEKVIRVRFSNMFKNNQQKTMYD